MLLGSGQPPPPIRPLNFLFAHALHAILPDKVNFIYQSSIEFIFPLLHQLFFIVLIDTKLQISSVSFSISFATTAVLIIGSTVIQMLYMAGVSSSIVGSAAVRKYMFQMCFYYYYNFC